MRGAIASPRPTHRAALTDCEDFGRLLRAIDAYEGRSASVRDALLLLACTAARPGELRLAQWDEFDFEAMLVRQTT
jgi:integrase